MVRTVMCANAENALVIVLHAEPQKTHASWNRARKEH